MLTTIGKIILLTAICLHFTIDSPTLLQTYMMHAVYKSLFQSICSCVADRDAQLNKVTHNLKHIQLRDIGVRQQLW